MREVKRHAADAAVFFHAAAVFAQDAAFAALQQRPGFFVDAPQTAEVAAG